jgi:hypothetical protein
MSLPSPPPFQSKLGHVGLAFIELKQSDSSWTDSPHRKAAPAEIRAMYGPRRVPHVVQYWDRKTERKLSRTMHLYHSAAFTFDEVIHSLDRRRQRALETDDPMHLWDAVSTTYSEQQIRDALTGHSAPIIENNNISDDDIEDDDIDPAQSWG